MFCEVRSPSSGARVFAKTNQGSGVTGPFFVSVDERPIPGYGPFSVPACSTRRERWLGDSRGPYDRPDLRNVIAS